MFTTIVTKMWEIYKGKMPCKFNTAFVAKFGKILGFATTFAQVLLCYQDCFGLEWSVDMFRFIEECQGDVDYKAVPSFTPLAYGDAFHFQRIGTLVSVEDVCVCVRMCVML